MAELTQNEKRLLKFLSGHNPEWLNILSEQKRVGAISSNIESLSLNEQTNFDMNLILPSAKKDEELIRKELDTSPESALQWAYLLKEKNPPYVEINKNQCLEIKRTEEAENYLHSGGLPEMQIFNKIGSGISIIDLKNEKAFNIGFGQLRKRKLINISNNFVTPVNGAIEKIEEDFNILKNPRVDERTQAFINRGLLQKMVSVIYRIRITTEGLKIS